VGYLIAKPEIAAKIRKNIVAMSNVLAVEAAKEALQDKTFYQFSLAKNKEAKQKIYKLLDYLNLDFIPSHTNFVFFSCKKRYSRLGKKNVSKRSSHWKAFSSFLRLVSYQYRNLRRGRSFC
jgi:histidinol-phosphate aminotransferase